MFALERKPCIGQMSKADRKLWPTNTNWCGLSSHWYVNSNDSVKGRFYFFFCHCQPLAVTNIEIHVIQKWRERLPNIICSRCPPPFSLFWFIIIFFFYLNFCADLICKAIAMKFVHFDTNTVNLCLVSCIVWPFSYLNFGRKWVNWKLFPVQWTKHEKSNLIRLWPRLSSFRIVSHRIEYWTNENSDEENIFTLNKQLLVILCALSIASKIGLYFK